MEVGKSVLEAIYEEEEDEGDFEMNDVEEGEVIEQIKRINLAKSSSNGGGWDVPVSFANESAQTKNSERSKSNKQKKKKKNKKRRRRGGPGPNVTDINKFVLDICRRLKERKSYMVYNAVACLGVSRLTDLVKEVDAVQSCGGQMTADGGRFRTGGGILWNIMKTKEPKSYQQIMKMTKEFEKQLRQQNIRQASQLKKEGSSQETVLSSFDGALSQQKKEGSSQETVFSSFDGALSSVSNSSQLVPLDQHEQSTTESKHKSVHDRIRVPVSYDDLLEGDPKNNSA